MKNKNSNFTLTTFKHNKHELLDAIAGGILMLVLLGSILFIYSLLSVWNAMNVTNIRLKWVVHYAEYVSIRYGIKWIKNV